jgi:hypothetical protein
MEVSDRLAAYEETLAAHTLAHGSTAAQLEVQYLHSASPAAPRRI